MRRRPLQFLIIVLGLLVFGASHTPQAAAQSVQQPTQPTIVRMTFSQARVTEGDGAAVSNVALTLAFDSATGAGFYDAEHILTINFDTRNGAAAGRDAATAGTCNTPGADYAPASGSLTFSGQASTTFNVQVCSDGLSEGNEQFAVRFDAIEPNQATAVFIQPLVNQRDAIVTITDDEALPTLSITPAVEIHEPAAGQAAAVFTVSLAGAKTQRPVTVDFRTAPGTATAGTACPARLENVDYLSRNGTLTFDPPPFQSLTPITRQIQVPVCSDSRLQEPNETFSVTLTHAVHAALPVSRGSPVRTLLPEAPGATGTATIVD